MRTWKPEDLTCEESPPLPGPFTHWVAVWFHDESAFYANDHHKVCWEHKDEDALPQTKGEGASLIVADFMSADYGFLQSPDGKEAAWVLFKAGKTRDGYFSSDKILKHATCAMDIFEKYYPGDEHVFVFDNATSHVKRADDTLSACHMLKKPSAKWGVEVLMTDIKGKTIFGTDGKPWKMKISMAPACLQNGEPQLLYFPNGHHRRVDLRGWNRFFRNGATTPRVLSQSARDSNMSQAGGTVVAAAFYLMSLIS